MGSFDGSYEPDQRPRRRPERRSANCARPGLAGDDVLSAFARVEIGLILVGILLAIGYRAMLGELRIPGLLASSLDNPAPTLHRLQLITATAVVAGAYGGQAMFGAVRSPHVPAALIGLLAASNAVYLAGKLGSRARQSPGGLTWRL
jgi:hypothetical protein